MGSFDEQDLTITVVNDTLSVSPAAPQVFEVDSAVFYQDFTVDGPHLGDMTNWSIVWSGTNPGGFDISSSGSSAGRLLKSGASTPGSVTGGFYQFKLRAEDDTCADNSLETGYYRMNISGAGANPPLSVDPVACSVAL